MKGTRPAHRPKRQFSSAKRQLCQPELKTCPHCGGQLKSTRTLYINKDVQTLDGVVNVRAYGYYCSNPNCPHPEERYHAVKQVLHISLPFGTYGLDVIAFIGWQREREHRQFAEIQGRLSSRGVAISERHVGRLYRQYLALLAGLTEQITATLKETEEEYGGVIWALDGLQPDQDGTQLYVLYEVLSQTPGGAAWFDKRDAARLQTWLEPYGQLDLTVLATLSDGEEAEITAMKAVWSGVVHQMCQVHFLGDIGEPIRDGDQRLRKALAVELKKLPSLPGNPAATGVQPQARTLELEMPASDSRANTSPVEEQKETKTAQDRLHRPALRRRPGIPGKSPLGSIQGKAKRAVPASKGSRQSAQTEGGRSTPAEESAVPEGEEDTLLQMQEMEFLFRKAFQDVLRRPSRKPLTFGGLAGYEQLQSLTCTLQLQLPKGGSSYLHTLLEKGQGFVRNGDSGSGRSSGTRRFAANCASLGGSSHNGGTGVQDRAWPESSGRGRAKPRRAGQARVGSDTGFFGTSTSPGTGHASFPHKHPSLVDQMGSRPLPLLRHSEPAAQQRRSGISLQPFAPWAKAD